MTVRQLDPVLNKNVNLAFYYKICNKKQQQQILIIDIGLKIPFHFGRTFQFYQSNELTFSRNCCQLQLYSNNENKLMPQKGNIATYPKTSLLRSRLAPYLDLDSIWRGFIFGRYKMELTSNYKTGRQLCLQIHIVAITGQCYLNFHMGIKFREDLFSRISISAIFLQSRRTRN